MYMYVSSKHAAGTVIRASFSVTEVDKSAFARALVKIFAYVNSILITNGAIWSVTPHSWAWDNSLCTLPKPFLRVFRGMGHETISTCGNRYQQVITIASDSVSRHGPILKYFWHYFCSWLYPSSWLLVGSNYCSNYTSVSDIGFTLGTVTLRNCGYLRV